MPGPQFKIMVDGLNLSRGGGVVVIKRLIETLASRQFGIVVLTSRDIREFEVLPSNVRLIKIPEAAGKLASIRFRLLSLQSIARRESPNLVISINYHTPYLEPQTTLHLNLIPHLPFRDRIRYTSLSSTIAQSYFARRAARRSDLNIFESCYLKRLCEASGTRVRQGIVRYMGVDPLTSVAATKKSMPDLVCVTSGAPHKRNDIVVSLYQLASLRDPRLRLRFVGDRTAILDSLSQENRSYCVSKDSVIFDGYTDRQTLSSIFSNARALVSASELESFFMVAIEAMSADCPVIVPNETSARETVGNAAFILDPDELRPAADHIHALEKSDVRLDWVERGRARAKYFDAALCGEKIADDIEEQIRRTGA